MFRDADRSAGRGASVHDKRHARRRAWCAMRINGQELRAPYSLTSVSSARPSVVADLAKQKRITPWSSPPG